MCKYFQLNKKVSLRNFYRGLLQLLYTWSFARILLAKVRNTVVHNTKFYCSYKKTGIETTANLVKIQVSLKTKKTEQAESVKSFIKTPWLWRIVWWFWARNPKWFLVHLYQGRTQEAPKKWSADSLLGVCQLEGMDAGRPGKKTQQKLTMLPVSNTDRYDNAAVLAKGPVCLWFTRTDEKKIRSVESFQI